ncbi:MAG TPA: glycosyltransferase family 39 protein [Chloroflexota bacterium]|nr:glycosyltransferase family 39 protein [Chloroflexota bacterium]
MRVPKQRSVANSPVVYHLSALAVILLGFAARAYRLGGMAIEFDEAFSIRTAAANLADILHAVATYEPHPPFYYSFLHFWYPVFGTSEFSLRFPSVLANVLTIALMMRLATSLGWRWPGVLAGLLCAVNPYQVWYAQEARMYAPVILFGLLAVYGALRAVHRNRRRDLGAYIGLMLLALYTHYYAIFLGIFINLLVLAVLRNGNGPAHATRRAQLTRWLGAQAVVALLYLPWLAYAYRVSLGYSRAPVDFWGMLHTLGVSLVDFSIGTSFPAAAANTVALAFLVVLVIGLWGVGQRGSPWPAWRRYLLVVGYLLLPLTLGFIASFARSMFQPRYFLVSAPAFFLLLGLGVHRIWRISWPVGIAVTAFLIAVQLQSLTNYFVNPLYDKSEPADAVVRVGGLVGPSDAVILDGWGQSNQFWYYHDLLHTEPAPGYVLPLTGPGGWEATLPEIDQIMDSHRGAWLLTYTAPEIDGQRLIEGYLYRNYFPVSSVRIVTKSVMYFASPPPTPPRVTPIGDTCNNSLRLDAVEVYGGSGPAGTIVPVALRWRATGPISRDYGVSWRLRDSEGHTVLQRDAQPASGFSPTTGWKTGQEVLDRYGVRIPGDLPPGPYNLEVIAFDRTSGAECVFRHGQTALPDPAVPLTTIRVVDAPPIATPDNPAPTRPLLAALGPLTLDGYDLDKGPYRPGDSLSPRLYWWVNRPSVSDVVATVRLLDKNGVVVAEESEKLGTSGFPTSRWQTGRAVADYLDVSIPQRAQTGTYQLAVSVAGVGLPATSVRLGPIPIVARAHQFEAPPIPHSLSASFGGRIGLLGYDTQPAPEESLRPGESLDLTLTWRDLHVIPKSYKVFTHLVGPDGKTYGQDDDVPRAGQAPTDSWLPGEIIVDHYQLKLQASAPAGRYTLVVGFYDPESGARLPLDGQKADALTIATFTVAPK